MIISTRKLDIKNAVDMATYMIHARVKNFTLDTQFGIIAIDVKAVNDSPVDVYPWKMAPATKFVIENMRREDIHMYVVVKKTATQSIDVTRLYVIRGLCMAIAGYLIGDSASFIKFTDRGMCSIGNNVGGLVLAVIEQYYSYIETYYPGEWAAIQARSKVKGIDLLSGNYKQLLLYNEKCQYQDKKRNLSKHIELCRSAIESIGYRTIQFNSPICNECSFYFTIFALMLNLKTDITGHDLEYYRFTEPTENIQYDAPVSVFDVMRLYLGTDKNP